MDPHLETRRENQHTSCVVVGPSVFLSSGDGYVGNFLRCFQGVKDSFEAKEGRWDFPRDVTLEEGLISLWGENILVFLDLWQQVTSLGSSRVTTGTSGTRSCGLRKAQSPCEFWEGSRDSSAVAARDEDLMWSWGWNLRVILQCWHGSRGPLETSSCVETCKSALLLRWKSSVRLPLKLT